jgi:hypothetical protein
MFIACEIWEWKAPGASCALTEFCYLPRPSARDWSLCDCAPFIVRRLRLYWQRDRGAVESSVPLARDLHPEFGYMGSGPRLWRKLGLVLAFIAFGLVAAASGVTVFMAGPEPDPMHAMALAPAEPLIRLPGSAPPAAADAVSAQRTAKAGRIKPPPCRENAMANLGGDCTPGRAPKPVQAANERPAIATVAIGHGDGPAILPSEPAIAVAATPQTPDGSAMPADAAEAPPVPAVTDLPPAAASKKSRTRQVQRRDHGGHPHSFTYRQNGFARLW